MHGFTEHIFGLCYLLGYSFMPRLRSATLGSLFIITITSNNTRLIGLRRKPSSARRSTRLNSNKGTKCDMGFGVIPFIDWVFGLRSTPKIAPRLVHQFWEPNPPCCPVAFLPRNRTHRAG